MSDISIEPASGRLVGDSHSMPIRIYYEDTDFSGVVYHASYLRFFERGRTEFIRAIGVDQKALHQETGAAFVVRAMTVEFLRPARMDDVVAVTTRPHELRGPTLRLAQTITRGADVLTTAEVTVVCVKDGRPLRLPEMLRAALAAAQAAAAGR